MSKVIILQLEPPSVTHQDQAVRVVHGHPMFYDTKRLKEARKSFMAALAKEKHEKIPKGTPVKLSVDFYHTVNKSHEPGEWKTTKPDTDNMIKLLKDCLTRTGYWEDDCQVVDEHTTKQWSSVGYIHIEIEVIG